MIEEIQRRREDALQTARTLMQTTKTITRLQQETFEASAILTKLTSGTSLSENELKALGLPEASPFLLKMRIQGLLRTKNETLAKLQNEQRQMSQMLKELATCPACEGSSTVTTKQYIRDEGVILPQTKTEECSYCRGTGKMELGEEIVKLIESLDIRTTDG